MLYIDHEHPVVQKIAAQIQREAQTETEIVEYIFYYVRDNILFGFHPEIDQLTASEIIQRGSGQCNNKSLVFVALCRALNIPVKLFFSDIDRSIHRGLIPAFIYPIFPKNISHSWVEVQINGQWHRVDAYINDAALFHAGRAKLIETGQDCGYSVADPTQASIEFSLDEESFVQMAAVTKSHGMYDNPADYFNSPLYRNRPGGLRRIISRFILQEMDRRVHRLRNEHLQKSRQTTIDGKATRLKASSI